MLVIENKNRQPTLDIATTTEYTGIETVIWNPSIKSIFDMYEMVKPELIVVYEDTARRNFDELIAAQEKYSPKGKIAILNMDFNGENAFGFKWTPCKNLILNVEMPLKPEYEVDIALILDDDLEETHHSFALELAEEIGKHDYCFRIYSNFVNHPNCVGLPGLGDYKFIAAHSKVLIDPRNEPVGNSIFNKNLGFAPEGICSTVERCVNYLTTGCKMDSTDIPTNFRIVEDLLREAGFQGAANKVFEKGGYCESVHWHIN